MLAAVIFWFSCCNAVITSDKFIYLSGKVIPSLSLIFLMVLRFVPRFAAQIKIICNARSGIGKDISSGSIINRAKQCITILSVMVTWALENAIETADSMKSRGYGLPCRTSFSIYTFDKRSKITLILIILLDIYTAAGTFSGGMHFSHFPYARGAALSFYGISVFCAYFILCVMPVIIKALEAFKWKFTESKI